MDMPITTSSDAVTPRFVLDQIMAGTGTVVTAGDEEGRALLDAVAQLLAGSRQRAIRVSVPVDGLSLSGLMAGITGQRDLATHDDAVLELGFRALTAADETCDGTVLLVSGADRLQRPALRYIQFACRAAKELRVVLAGTAALPGVLAGDELAALRTRLTMLPATVPAPAAILHEPQSPPRVALPARQVRRVPGWATAGLGMAASLALGLWIGRSGPQPPATVTVDLGSTATRVVEAPVQPTVATAQPAEAAATPTPDMASTQAALPPLAIPAEIAPRAVPREAETPVQQATAMPVRPAADTTPTPMVDQADNQAALPVPPQLVLPPARQARANPPRRADTRTTEAAAARRIVPAQRATVVARPPPGPIRLDSNDDGPRTPRSLQPEDTFGPQYSSLGRPRSFIGTYSANPDGTRSFRMEP